MNETRTTDATPLLPLAKSVSLALVRATHSPTGEVVDMIVVLERGDEGPQSVHMIPLGVALPNDQLAQYEAVDLSRYGLDFEGAYMRDEKGQAHPVN